MICGACREWIEPIRDKKAQTVACPKCGRVESRPFLPLFIVTGPSGAGKTAVVADLQRLMPDWEVFETELLWDSGGDWNTVKCNWLRIADFIAHREPSRLTILCGTMQPQDLESCESRDCFSRIHWLALLCDEETLARRLRARPAWRGCDETFIAEQLNYARWFRKNAETAFDPPLMIIDTTDAPISQSAVGIRDWAMGRLRGE